ncbi:MAG: acyl-CoA ligase (AMP-forming), exosortase A system-associated [Gammaproteobacteria bacterium]|nr:acyl-CoA ligase (AMP-forming), exosortase A system-associated [Gammaproteobacteria bacterium]
MLTNLYDIVSQSAAIYSDKPALKFKNQSVHYNELLQLVDKDVQRFLQAGLCRFQRLAVFLPKQFETVTSFFATARCGGVFVPVNPALKPLQVQHILQDCNVRILVTSQDRYAVLAESLALCEDLHTVLLVDVPSDFQQQNGHLQVAAFHRPNDASDPVQGLTVPTDADVAAILYTSGSTGKPKGVVLSHCNMMVGAQSVSSYLGNKPTDVILALLPLSFDYGLSQITTAFLTGATVVLLDFFLVQDVVRAIEQNQVTGLAAVPPLWAQLAKAKWPEGSAASVRYLTNSGGAMPDALLTQLQGIFKNAEPYLMYGLTEAFRSTYLPPADLPRKRGSMGKAIPNAEIVVVREDGSLCGPNEPGELVHRGPLVSLGYWNAPEKTAERFKFDPVMPKGALLTPMAVWSGDTVKYDDEGFLFFVGRRDEMIKTLGNRVSPTEVEEAVYALDPTIVDVAALGIAHPELDQAILVLVAMQHQEVLDTNAWLLQLKKNLPSFMVPRVLLQKDSLPKNANGKIDRKLLAGEYQHYFSEGQNL